MNLTILSAAISNTGIALLDSSSTYDRLVISVGEQQQLVVSTLDKTVKEGELIPAQTIILEGLDLSNEHNQRFFALALHGIQFTKQTPYATEKQHERFMAWRLVNITLPRLMGMIDDKEATSRATKGIDSFNFADYGLNPDMFVTSGDGYNYRMPSNGDYKGCIKVYLKAEYKRAFDDLADDGLLVESYGRNLVKDGLFVGNFAVLIPAKKGA